jgi:cytochrome c-type biogenesis protein CcmH
MIWLFIAAIAIAIAAAIFAARGIGRPVSSGSDSFHELAIRRDRLIAALNELDAERADKALDSASAHDEELRLSSELADVLRRIEAINSAPGRRGDAQSANWLVTAGVLAVSVPVVAGGLYWLNNSTMATGLARMAMGEGPPPAANVPPMVVAMVGRLEERLRENPDDAEGWARLGRSYMVLERKGDALDAYRKAYELTPDNPQVVSEYAWLVFNAHPDRTSGLAHELYTQLNKLEPENPDALWFLGLARYQQKDVRGALSYWERLARLLPKESPEAAELDKVIAKARAES